MVNWDLKWELSITGMRIVWHSSEVPFPVKLNEMLLTSTIWKKEIGLYCAIGLTRLLLILHSGRYAPPREPHQSQRPLPLSVSSPPPSPLTDFLHFRNFCGLYSPVQLIVRNRMRDLLMISFNCVVVSCMAYRISCNLQIINWQYSKTYWRHLFFPVKGTSSCLLL